MTTLAIARNTRNAKIVYKPKARTASAPLPRELDDLAGLLEMEASATSQWLAGRLRGMAERARFLQATTTEDYDTREQTLNATTFTVRPCPKVSGRYRSWDVVDGNGKVARACTDLFDAMMWIQETLLH